ncbi:PP220 [Orf virus]|uniref:PP220 n=1 Tax=Orf virus TaxID=10258 RepID=F1AX89_ORFV|nr:PP220 [Orf virus]
MSGLCASMCAVVTRTASLSLPLETLEFSAVGEKKVLGVKLNCSVRTPGVLPRISPKTRDTALFSEYSTSLPKRTSMRAMTSILFLKSTPLRKGSATKRSLARASGERLSPLYTLRWQVHTPTGTEASPMFTEWTAVVKRMREVARLSAPVMAENFLDMLYTTEFFLVANTRMFVCRNTRMPTGTSSMRTKTSVSWMDTTPDGGTSTISAVSGKPSG